MVAIFYFGLNVLMQDLHYVITKLGSTNPLTCWESVFLTRGLLSDFTPCFPQINSVASWDILQPATFPAQQGLMMMSWHGNIFCSTGWLFVRGIHRPLVFSLFYFFTLINCWLNSGVSGMGHISKYLKSLQCKQLFLARQQIQNRHLLSDLLTHWGQDKIIAILQTFFLNTFSSMKKFDWIYKHYLIQPAHCTKINTMI